VSLPPPKCKQPDAILPSLPCDRPPPCEIHNKEEAAAAAVRNETNDLLQKIVARLDELVQLQRSAIQPKPQRRKKAVRAA